MKNEKEHKIALHPDRHRVSAFAPATCANVAVGFDILGFAFPLVGDTVTLTGRSDTNILIEKIEANDTLPLDPDKNICSWVIKKLCQNEGIESGFSITLHKGIPVSSGMGGSAASAVAALVACNAFLDPPLTRDQLAAYALLAEERVSGEKHADNIVPCLWGGFTLIHSLKPLSVISLPVPDIYCVLVHPHLYVPTELARSVLKPQVALKDHIHQSGYLAAFMSALYQQDTALLLASLKDLIIEPQRAHFVPGFAGIKLAAQKAGAFDISFSGSGPTLFAFAAEEGVAESIKAAIQSELGRHHLESDAWVAKMSRECARVVSIEK